MTKTHRLAALCLAGATGSMLVVAALSPAVAAKKRVAPAAQTVADQPSTPEILMTAANRVPACITADRLDSALRERNPRLDARFNGIAALYKLHGEKLGVRWDYAFYQMILETNSLLFTGDVKAAQNNFAGLGATGGGVRGESFADVSSGVLAQLQHLVAYAGQKVDTPVAKRTRDNQDGIIAQSKRLGRAVRFADLTNRWAADSRYARMIDTLAGRFQGPTCSLNSGVAAVTPAKAVAPKPEQPPTAAATAEPAAPVAERRRKGRDLARQAIDDSKVEQSRSAALGAAPVPAQTCAVMAASFGGSVTLLIRAEQPGAVTFTALDVDGGTEQAMAESYMKVHAPGGSVAGRFPSRDDAIAHAYNLCDSGKP